MRMKVQTVMMGMTVLLMVTGCGDNRTNEYSNEVVLSFREVHSQGDRMWCFEKKDPQSPEIRDVVSSSSRCVLQVYRIEGHAVTQCYFITNLFDRGNALNKVFEKEGGAAWEAIRRLPNVLKTDWVPKPIPQNHPVFSIVDMCIPPPMFPEPRPNEVVWDEHWCVHKWTGDAQDIPTEVETLHQNIIHAISSPSNTRSYSSYLRAVPLLTKEEVEVEKDTPVIDVTKARYHAQHAIYKPYVLFPIPEAKSPFPTVRKYTPGDKFKVRLGDEYFLIETFVGKIPTKEKQ